MVNKLHNYCIYYINPILVGADEELCNNNMLFIIILLKIILQLYTYD